ncbi:MAG TPA: hypothetical protein VKB07_11340 [Gaiellaceae bacterium]|jgi:hypothetical protein|nr:hypothetical protein [Gaiellaceae bacterium]
MSRPRLRVALPAAICENGETLSEFRDGFDDLLSEWAAMLDPVAALRQEYWLAAPWALAGWASVAETAVALLREAAKDGALVQLFADSLEHHSLVEGDHLGESAMPLLLGLAVTRTVQKGVGERSLKLRERLENEGAWLPASGVPTDAGVASYRSVQLPSVR